MILLMFLYACESRGEDAIRCELSYMYMYHIYSADPAMQNKARVGINSLLPVVVVDLLFYVHSKHLRSCRDGQLT